MDSFFQALSRRILILDGAMGTQLQRHGLSGNSEAFNLLHPEIVKAIHRSYIEAGADIIETNTFGANAISQAEYGLATSASQFALEGARLAREVADAAPRKVWVAGSMGPSGKSLSLSQDATDPASRACSFDEMVWPYTEQVAALVKGGVDLLLLETCFDALNTKAALYAISRIPEAAALPLMISVSVADRSGRTLTGQTIEAFYRSVEHARPVCFGLNCSMGADDMAPLLADVASWAPSAVSCYPNAGLPNEMGAYDQTPDQMAAALRRMAEKGLLNIAGGCCGSTPEHIRAIAGALEGCAPRVAPAPDGHLHLSGLEALTVDLEHSLFTNIGERTNVAGSRKFAKLIAAGNYSEALEVAAGQIEKGASVIDVSLDDAMLDSTAEMERFLRHIAGDPAVARVPLMIDSSHWDTLVTGLKNAQGRCIVNSLSLKEGEAQFLEKAREVHRLGAALVVMAFDEDGQAVTYERKISICRRVYKLLTEKAGYAPSDIIFDVNVLSVGTGIAEHTRYGIDFIRAVRWIKQNLGGVYTSGGISNLSFAFRGNNLLREAMHTVFLYHAVAAGLDMGIVNPGALRVYDEIDPALREAIEDVVLGRNPAATERLTELAQGLSASDTPAEQTAPREDLPAEERLSRALVSGGSTTLKEDLLEVLDKTGKAVDVIEGPLMEGMSRVGERFAAGKMFLPQVVKSAKVMRDAVEILQPYMNGEEGESSERPRILMATVKGDVHDIGKNITGIVLSCNGFEVIDLGVMVHNETILEKAEACGAAIIGVSGLITPSLYQMEQLCREMALRGLSTPLMVGGATTSALHTAVKLAPLYEHVFHARDASAAAVLAARLMQDREGTEAAEHAAQASLRSVYKRKEAAPSTPHPFAPETYLQGNVFPNLPAREIPLEELLPHFDWNLFYVIWSLKGPEAEGERARLKADASSLLAHWRCPVRISARFDACVAKDDVIVAPSWRLPMLRGEGLSLADFVAPESYGFSSPVGMFAVSVHRAHVAGQCDCAACSTRYESMLERSVRLTLAEAASAWLEDWMKRYSDVKVVKPAIGFPSCPDHSLKRDVLRLLSGVESLDIRLTETCVMIPDASICALVFPHPMASYPDIRRVDTATLERYAALRGFSPEEKERYLHHLQ